MRVRKDYLKNLKFLSLEDFASQVTSQKKELCYVHIVNGGLTDGLQLVIDGKYTCNLGNVIGVWEYIKRCDGFGNLKSYQLNVENSVDDNGNVITKLSKIKFKNTDAYKCRFTKGAK